MCAQALVLLAQWLRVQQVPGQYQWPADHEADRPTLIECIRFQGKERIINLPQEIGTSYDDFCLLLLDDCNGRRIHFIACQHKDDARWINKEVLKEWIVGRGKHPVTWKTLNEGLHDIELSTLARDWNCQDITTPFLNGLGLGAEVISIECHLCHNNKIHSGYLYCCFVYTLLTMYFLPCPHPLQFYMMN